jgi:hypothetical protein
MKEGGKARRERNQSGSPANGVKAQQTRGRTPGPTRKQTRNEVGPDTPKEDVRARLKTLAGGIDEALKGQQAEHQGKLQDLWARLMRELSARDAKQNTLHREYQARIIALEADARHLHAELAELRKTP